MCYQGNIRFLWFVITEHLPLVIFTKGLKMCNISKDLKSIAFMSYLAEKTLRAEHKHTRAVTVSIR